MTLAHAKSLLAGRTIVDQPHTPEEDAASLHRLAEWMLSFAPVVSTDGADGLMLDIAGCQHLFGGEREQIRQIDRAFGRWGISARLAAAPTFGCAWAVARFASERISLVGEDTVDSALGPLPIEALRVPTDMVESLADVGVERIEQLLLLPRDELAARFGRELVRRIDQATGAIGETIESVKPPVPVEVSREFDGPVKRIEIVELAVRELIEVLAERLHREDAGALELTARFCRVDIEPIEVSIRMTHPSRDAKHIGSLLGPRVERVHLGYGVERIDLRANRTAPLFARQSSFLRDLLIDDAADECALGELVDRFVDRLGASSVTRVEAVESYVPEQAFVHTEVRNAKVLVARAKRGERRCHSAHRPSELFMPPQAARVISLVPHGPPAWIDWQGESGEIVTSLGPERIALPWWTQGRYVVRDYYEIEDRPGRWLWIFRDGETGGWFVQGRWL